MALIQKRILIIKLFIIMTFQTLTDKELLINLVEIQ
jgi:hypothetical protein